jgi:hypothetical protein
MKKIGRRTGDEAPKVKVVATPEMVELRKAQTRLNHFLWTTEICYGHVLARASSDFADPEMPVNLAFGHVRTAAWFPNNQGREKFTETTGRFLDQTRKNTADLYRHVLVGYYAYCEEYLEQRALQLRVGNAWGPFVRSLSGPALRTAPTPLLLHTVLCADLCRLVRNLIVHEPYEPLPVAVDERVKKWQTKLLKDAMSSGWPASERDSHEAVQQVIGQVKNHLKGARDEGKELPPELFYLLFTFTNLDQLACQIEEALLARGEPLTTWVKRSLAKVRRHDLVIPDTPATGTG